MRAKKPREHRKVTVYRPDSRFEIGVFGALFALIAEVYKFRSHIKLLFANNFQSSYQDTALGTIWNFILPLVPIGLYIMLVTFRVLPQLEGLPPAVYISFNVTLWHLLSGVVRQPIDVVASRGNAVMKTAMPLSASIAASFAQLTFESLVRAGLVTVIVVCYGAAVMSTAPWALLVLLDALVFAFGLALGLSVLNVIFPDTERVVGIVLQYGIFFSGIIFPIYRMPKLEFLETYNPFYVFIHAARQLTFENGITEPVPFIACSCVGLVLLLVSVRFFYVMEYRLRGIA
jgi:ABC-type polysaccharide/polyol phosphate export permease